MDSTLPKLIAFSGLPGVGKSTLAKRLAAELRATYLRIDTIEQALVRSSLKIMQPEDAGYVTAYSVARDNLIVGKTVVADSVNPVAKTRNAWSEVAQRAQCQMIEIEIICSDSSEHRSRIETRTADIKGHQLPTWNEVVSRQYEPHKRDRILIDTANIDPDKAYSVLWDALQEA